MPSLPDIDIRYVVKPDTNVRIAYYTKLQELNDSSADCTSIVTELLNYVHHTALASLISFDSSITTKYTALFATLFNQNIQPTIANLNMLSLQYIILFTEIQKEIQKKDTKTIMAKYPIDQISTYYGTLVKGTWMTIDGITKLVKNLITSQHAREFERLLTAGCGIQNTCIIVLLGEMTFEELLTSMANRIHYVGFLPDMVWADGNYYSPFEFMHHDLIHAANFEYKIGGYISSYDILSQDFIKYLKEQYNSIDPTNNTIDISGVLITPTVDDYMYVLFIIAHETYDVHILDKSNNIYNFSDAFNIGLRYGLNTRLQNEHNLGAYIRGRGLSLNPDALSVSERRKYLEFIYTRLTKLMKAYRTPPASSSSNAAGGARKTRRKQKKHRATAKKRGRARCQGRNGGARD